MSREKCSLSCLILLTINTILFTWINLLSPKIAFAQTNSNFIPSLQLLQSASMLAVEDGESMASEVTMLPPEVKSAVLNDAVKLTGKTVSALKILSVKQQQWSDGCLGLGKANEICLQAITPGYKVVVTDGLKNWTYRTDNLGNTVRLE